MIDGGVHVPAIDDAPVAGLENGVMHVRVATAFRDHVDVLPAEAYRRIGQRQTQNALLRAGCPGHDGGIVVDTEVRDPEAGDGIDDAERTMGCAGVVEALNVVDPAGACLPVCHEGPHGLVLVQRRGHQVSGDGLPVGHLDDGDVRWTRVERIGGQVLPGRRLHADGQAVQAAEGAVDEGDHAVARQDGAERTIETAEARAADSVGVCVVGAEHLAQHELDLAHAAQHGGVHVIGHAGPSDPLEDRGVRVTRAGPGGEGVGDLESRENTHAASFPMAVRECSRWSKANC